MVKVLFVHGTGVRKPAFEETFRVVTANLEQFMPGVQVHPCYWGELGSNIRDGLSVPLYDQSKGLVGGSAEEDSLGEWALLYEDPLIELRLLVANNRKSKGAARDFGVVPPHTSMRDAMETLRQEAQSGRWHDAAKEAPARAAAAIKQVLAFEGFDTAVDAGVELAPGGAELLDPTRTLVARSVVAAWISTEMLAGAALVAADERDDMVFAAVQILGGGKVQTKGIGDNILKLVTKPLKAVARAALLAPALRIAAWGSRSYRHSMADVATPGVGDVLLYQARGEDIRDFIAEAIQVASGDAGSPVVLIAHSLGGIACIDLLIAASRPAVKGVITVGSQAPYLYEIGALSQLEFGIPLPGHVPPWLNIYDRDDLLSFVAAKVMKGGSGVEDIEIRSGQPFPASHGAYWRQPEVWKAVSSFIHSVSA